MALDRRDFLKTGTGVAGALSLLPLALGDAAQAQGEAAAGERAQTESGKAYAELVATLQEAEAKYLSAERRITRAPDVSDGHRFLLHILQTGLFLRFEMDSERPVFRRIVSPTRKLLGDNPDAIYYEAPVQGDRRYRIKGNTAGATYTSFTVEAGGPEGGYPESTDATLNDLQMTVDADGNFEITLGPEVSGPNTMKLSSEARTVTTRSYFETKQSAAANPLGSVPLTIEPLDDPGPAPSPDDASIARAIRRVVNYVRGNTLDHTLGLPGQEQESWVSTVPNQFNPPAKPGDMAFSATDNAYAMAPYVLRPDQALVITGRFPECRFSNVVLWNRFLQTYDYVHRRTSLNRAQTTLDDDGRYRIVIAAQDPGVPNWIDNEGRLAGIVYWRFLLPEGEIETPQAEVVPVASLKS